MEDVRCAIRWPVAEGMRRTSVSPRPEQPRVGRGLDWLTSIFRALVEGTVQWRRVLTKRVVLSVSCTTVLQ